MILHTAVCVTNSRGLFLEYRSLPRSICSPQPKSRSLLRPMQLPHQKSSTDPLGIPKNLPPHAMRTKG